jgi:hypothetical protein
MLLSNQGEASRSARIGQTFAVAQGAGGSAAGAGGGASQQRDFQFVWINGESLRSSFRWRNWRNVLSPSLISISAAQVAGREKPPEGGLSIELSDETDYFFIESFFIPSFDLSFVPVVPDFIFESVAVPEAVVPG